MCADPVSVDFRVDLESVSNIGQPRGSCRVAGERRWPAAAGERLKSRFQVDSMPDKHTLLALKLDPSVNTTVEDGIFSSCTASQQLMVGEYRSRLVRR